MSQYAINHSNNCFDTTNSYNTVSNNYTPADDRSQLLSWLSPLDPGLRHSDIRERRVNDVGGWLMTTEEFRRWHRLEGESEDDMAVLFCYGNPGVGKTFISSLVADSLCDQANGQTMAVACFYFDFAARKEQTATSMLGSLLKQVVSGMETIPEEVSRAFQEHKETMGGCRPQLAVILKMLQALTSSQRIFICIDALDECAAVQRFRVLDSLNQILEKCPWTRIFATGRPHIRPEIEKRLTGRVASVSVGLMRKDIIRFLLVRLDEDETPYAMNAGLKAKILTTIPRNISETFLLVSLNIQAILQEPIQARRLKRLTEMTDGLGLEDAYGATIERIKAQGGGKSRLGMAALMWISHAERPLMADELCQALAIELGSLDFDADNVPSRSMVADCCQGLIAVDKEASTVRLIHFTLQEYLSAHHDIFATPHTAMSETCLTYLNSAEVKAISADPTPDIRDTPFLEYCSVYWGAHAKKEPSDRTISLSLKLLQQYDGHISGKLLLDQARHLYVEDFSVSFRFNGLHCASLFGIVEVAYALIQKGICDINDGDFGGYTPLAWAARNGHDKMVIMLLGWEMINPDKPDSSGYTPLSHAAGRGHEAVVKILLGRGEVNPHRPNNHGLTPLSCAAHSGHEGVVKILLELEVNPDQANCVGVTPLSGAARNGHEGVVKMLLWREDVDPNKPNNYGSTPLSCAAHNGHEGVVKILLEREDVDPGRPNCVGMTPLMFAARHGHDRVMALLEPHKPIARNPV